MEAAMVQNVSRIRELPLNTTRYLFSKVRVQYDKRVATSNTSKMMIRHT